MMYSYLGVFVWDHFPCARVVMKRVTEEPFLGDEIGHGTFARVYAGKAYGDVVRVQPVAVVRQFNF